jgi:hypothetical protein
MSIFTACFHGSEISAHASGTLGAPLKIAAQGRRGEVRVEAEFNVFLEDHVLARRLAEAINSIARYRREEKERDLGVWVEQGHEYGEARAS